LRQIFNRYLTGNSRHVLRFMPYLLKIRRNDDNANFKNEYCNRTNIDFVKVKVWILDIALLKWEDSWTAALYSWLAWASSTGNRVPA